MAKLDLQNRRPKVEKLADSRLRATFTFDVLEYLGQTKAQIAADVFAAWITDATTFGYPGLKLIRQDLLGSPADGKADALTLVRVYEELDPAAETQIGNNEIHFDPDGRKVVVAKFVLPSTATFTPGTVGTSTAPGDGTVVLQKLEAPDDGTLRQITRTYTNGGTLSDSTETKNNGKLILRTIVTAKDAPATPAGFTLVAQKTDNPAGFPVYTFSFAKGTGRISLEVDTRQNGRVTATIVRYLGSDDGSTPSGVLLSTTIEQADGYTITTARYVAGSGTVSDTTETRNNGKLVLRTIASLGTPPATPSGFTAVEQASREEDGYTLYTYRFASGSGRVSLSTETKSGGKLVLTSIRYLGADDGATPSGTLVDTSVEQSDGYTITTRRYAAGSGRLSIGVEQRHNGNLTLTTVRYLGTDDETPPSGILVESSTEQADGYTVGTARYAIGAGRVSLTTETKNGGKLTLSTVRYLNSDNGSVPPGTLFENSYEEADGYTLRTDRYASGTGRLSLATQSKNNGKIVETTIRYLGSDDGSTPSGVNVETTTEQSDGYVVTTKRYAFGAGRLSLGTAYSFRGKLVVATIRFLAADDDVTPAGELIRNETQQEDGYILYTQAYASVTGDGYIIDDIDPHHGGKLVIYHKQRIGSSPTAPTATIGGTVTQIDSSTRHQEGFTIYDVKWAEGFGEISRETEYLQSIDQGATQGVTRITIRTLSRLGDTEPSSIPSGTVKVATSNTAQDGYLVWTQVYAKGTGIVLTGTETKHNGKLVLYSQTELNASASYTPATPAATLGSTVTLVNRTTRSEGGYIIFQSLWAEGKGEISRRIDPKRGGNLIVTTIRFLNADTGGTTPTGVLTINETEADGYGNILYLQVYVDANGGAANNAKVATREDGSTEYVFSNVQPLGVTGFGSYVPGGFLVATDIENNDGYVFITERHLKPPANYTRPIQVQFHKPGLVTAGNPPGVIPPVTLDLMGTETVSFSIMQTTAVPYTVSAYASLYEAYKRKADGVQVSQVKELPGYLGSSTLTMSSGTYRGIDITSAVITVSGSSPTALPTGTQNIAVRCEKYLTAIDGTTIWRNSVVIASV